MNTTTETVARPVSAPAPAGFTTGGGHAADSMGMAVLTCVALLCYATNLYMIRPPRHRRRPARPAG